jgi:hypothetical protein
VIREKELELDQVARVVNDFLRSGADPESTAAGYVVNPAAFVGFVRIEQNRPDNDGEAAKATLRVMSSSGTFDVRSDRALSASSWLIRDRVIYDGIRPRKQLGIDCKGRVF